MVNRRYKKFYGWEQLPVVVSVADAATVLRVTEQTVRQLLRDGVIAGNKAGKAWRIDKEILRKYVEGAA